MQLLIYLIINSQKSLEQTHETRYSGTLSATILAGVRFCCLSAENGLKGNRMNSMIYERAMRQMHLPCKRVLEALQQAHDSACSVHFFSIKKG